MAQGPTAGGSNNLELAYRVIPAEGINWGEIAHSRSAEAEFLDRMRPLLHPDFETFWRHADAEGGSQASRTSLVATIAALRPLGQAFATMVALPEVYVDLGDRVLVLLTREGRTADGAEFAVKGAAVYSFEDRRLRRMELYADRGLALADAGIDEDEAATRGVPVAEMRRSYAAFERE